MRPTSPLILLLCLPASLGGQALRHFTDALEVRSAPTQPVISYRLTVDSADRSGIAVEMRIRNAGDTIRLAMAAHPEYDDRYWRYLEDLKVESPAGPLLPVREDSALWRLVTPEGQAVVRYRIHFPTPPESPRGAWRPFLSPTGGLVGGPHSFLYVVGATLAPSEVSVELPPGWQIATGMTATGDPRSFFAPTVDALMDSPILVGRFRSFGFAVDGVPHRVVYLGAAGGVPFDTAAFTGGVERIARQAIALFGRAPYRDFIFMFQDSAYGGLEHRNSVTLGAPSASLARDLGDILSETAHEYFHTWNLMRIRPAEYGDVDYRTQKPVAGLWWSEGLTMYYADLLLRRAGLPTEDSTRVAHLEGLIARYIAGPGHSRFSAEAISLVAYNSRPGALGDYSASVHLVGELLGTILDLRIRDATRGRRSMDDVMPLMLERFSGERGFTGRDVERVVAEVCGCSVHDIFEEHIRHAGAIDFNRELGRAGLRVAISETPALDRDGKAALDLRIRGWQAPEGGPLRLFVYNPTSPFAKAGLHSDDQLIAINGRPIATWPELRTVLTTARIGDTLNFEVSRAGGPFRATVVMTGYTRPVVKIEELPDASPRQRALRDGWLASAEHRMLNAER